MLHLDVIPAQAEIYYLQALALFWIPADAGMTKRGSCGEKRQKIRIRGCDAA